MDSPNLDRAVRFKSNAQRGGVMENVFVRRINVGRVAEAILTIDFQYGEGAHGPHRPVVRNVHLEQIQSASSPRVLWIAGFATATIDQIHFKDCRFRGVEKADFVRHANGIDWRDCEIEPTTIPTRL
jgi:unsaturated rhamnogalacturonyl hydrolase